MIFKRENFKSIRKRTKLSTQDVADKAGIHRVTISNWERGVKKPSEKNIRLLAYVLNVNVSDISDLKDDIPISEGDLSEMAEAWQAFAGIQQKDIADNFEKVINQLQKQHNEFINASVVMNSLLSAMHTMFYAKDKFLNYITVNESFLSNVGLNAGYSAIGKRDTNFFSIKEATENTDEDLQVFRSGVSIEREGFIPGARRKKWGIIKKIPIFDSENRIAGIIGTFVDITERRKTEKQRRILEDSINKTDDMFWVGKYKNDTTDEFEYLFINDGVEEIFGVSKEDYTDVIWAKSLHEDFKHLLNYSLRNIKEFPLEYEYKIVRPDKKIRKIREKIYKSNDLFFGVDRDVTVYDEIQHLKDMLLMALDKALDYHIWIVDYSDGYKRVIPSGTEYKNEKIYGYSIEEFASSEGDLWKKIVYPDDLHKLMSTFTEGKFPKTIKYRVIDKEKKIRWIQDHIVKYKFEDKLFFLGLAKRVNDKE